MNATDTDDTATAAPKGDYARVNGLAMYYEVHGSGLPLVLLHGGIHTIDLSFGPMLPTIASAHQAIAVELQGHGHTADIDRDLALTHLADDVVALLDQLGIERADFFGFSLGGLTALQLAMSHPARMGRLVLAATHYRPDGYHEEIRNYQDHPESTRVPTEADFQEMAVAYAGVAPDPDGFEPFMAKTSAWMAAFEGWQDDDLRAIAAPTLLVVADRDFVRLEHAIDMYELIPDAQLAVIPGATHAHLMRRTDLVLPTVLSFLSR